MNARERILATGRILAAAAHADGHVEASEVHKIYEILEREWRDAGLGEELPREVLDAASALDARTTLAELARPFRGGDEGSKRKILELVVRVHDADGELDFKEDRFVSGLAKALGLASAKYQDLLLEILDEPAKPANRSSKTAAKKKAKKKR